MVWYKCTGISEDLRQHQNHSAIQYNIIRAGAWSGVGMRTFGITTLYPLLQKSEYKELLLTVHNTKLADCNDNA